MTSDPQFWQDQITAVKTLITAYNAAILALTVGGVQSYILDTGQSRQSVTKFDLKEMNTALDSLLNRLATLEARLGGCGVVIMSPAPGC
jgi:hypothetical protein